MIDASASLYSALPQSLGTARLPASRSLAQPDESATRGNSLRQVASLLRPESAIADFGPVPPENQGFASLAPVLGSLRLSPEQLNPIDENSKPTWEELLDTQQEITEARRAAAEELEAREQARRQAAAEQEILNQTIQELREEIIFTAEQQPEAASQQQAANGLQTDTQQNLELPGQQQPAAEPPAVLGQGNDQPETSLAPESSRIYPPDTLSPQVATSPPPAGLEPLINDAAGAEQRRIAQLYNANQNSQNTGTTINLFA